MERFARRIPKWDECAWTSPLYKEHDDAYYKECIENLAQKGIILEGENHV